MLFNDCIVLAGGAGTRLWPASSAATPKQFLSVPGDQNTGSMNFLTAAIDRALAVIEDSPDSRVIIIAGRDHVPAIVECCSVFTLAQKKHLVLIPEPEAKNTAPAIACSLLYSDWVNTGIDRKILILTSDHLINPLEVFKTDASAAGAFTQQDKLIVFGIPPVSPNTGYGYIETSALLTIPPGENLREEDYYDPIVYRAEAFREKPDKKQAEEFIKAGNFYWNSGMFAFSSKFMLEEFREKTPELLYPFLKLRAPNERSYSIRQDLRILENWEGLEEAYSAAPKISFDYAIAEKCSRTVMVKAAFKWTDVGSWDEYIKLVPVPGNPEVYSIDSENTFVDSDIPVALVNADDLIVVIRTGKNGEPQAALIAKKGETQKVQEIVRQIKEAGRTGLL